MGGVQARCKPGQQGGLVSVFVLLACMGA